MLPALILITSSDNKKSRLSLVNKHSYLNTSLNTTDLLLIDQQTESITIDQIRTLKAFFSTKPSTKDYKTAVLLYSENLTIAAQHALLKTLEEPPTFAQIILVSPHTHSFLPTILSRCQTINQVPHVTKPSSATKDFVQSLNPLSSGQKIALVDKLNPDRQTAIDLTNQLTLFYRHKLKSDPTSQNLYNLTLSLYTAKLLKQNTHIKLTLDNLLLNLKTQTPT